MLGLIVIFEVLHEEAPFYEEFLVLCKRYKRKRKDGIYRKREQKRRKGRRHWKIVFKRKKKVCERRNKGMRQISDRFHGEETLRLLVDVPGKDSHSNNTYF